MHTYIQNLQTLPTWALTKDLSSLLLENMAKKELKTPPEDPV